MSQNGLSSELLEELAALGAGPVQGGPDAGFQCFVVSGAALLVLKDFLLGGDLGERLFGLAALAEGFGLAVGGFADAGCESGLAGASGGVVGGQGGNHGPGMADT
ncbi:hypothetical protein ABT218_32555 [Streptomyces sp. NPDC001455]|uniref:hypothetical protein n=1 Tax=Streptomyces sp. NPDC001455 TaxID=3154518 RepID=UPI003320664D